MSSWTGLDPGGTEQLWQADILLGVLRIFKNREFAPRNDPISPIFLDLEETYPEITWQSTDKNGEFRPVFRKTNPWEKLGLISDNASSVELTELGEELVNGEREIQDVFLDAAKAHNESDGVRSFAKICEVFLALPTYELTAEDIEFGVADRFVYQNIGIKDAIDTVRVQHLRFDIRSRRSRTIRAIMSVLVNAGALDRSAHGWVLANASRAREIASLDSAVIESVASSATMRSVIPLRRKPDTTPSSIRVISKNASSRTYRVSSTTMYDPVKRALLMEKAQSIHQHLILKCAASIEKLGLTALEDQFSYDDVASVEAKTIIEAKSINQANATAQLRKAIAQLPEYRWRHKETFGSSTSLVVVTNCDPKPFVGEDYITFIELDRGIQIFWMEGDQLVKDNGTTLEGFLAQRL